MPRNVVLPDGRVVEVDDAAADRAGFRSETEDEADARGAAAEVDRRYGDPGSQIAAAGEGLLSGLTLGISDLVLDDPSTRGRAGANPGTRAIAEFAGAILPSVVNPASLAGRVVRASPSGLVTRAGESVRSGLGGVKGLGAQGALEGAAQGVGSSTSHAALSGDPLTLDAAVEGAGVGGLIGVGFGAIAGAFGMAGRLASKASKATGAQERALSKADPFAAVEREAMEKRVQGIDVEIATTPDTIRLPADKALETRLGAIDDELGALQDARPNLDGATKRLQQIDDELARRASDKAGKVGDYAPPIADDVFQSLRDDVDAVGRAAEKLPDSIDGLDKTRVISSREYRAAARAAGNDLLGQIDDAEKHLYRDEIGMLKKRWGALDANPGDAAAAAAHVEAMTALARKAKGTVLPMPRHPTVLAAEKGDALAQMALDRATGKTDEWADLAADVGRRTPKTVERFAKMNPVARAEYLNDLQRVAATKWGAPLKDALASFREAAQVTEGSLAEGVNRLYRDAADTMSGRLEKMLVKERRAVERQMRAAQSGSLKDADAARKVLMKEKAELLSARKAAEDAAAEAAGEVRRALKDERRALMGDLRGIPDPVEPKTAARTSDSWVKRIGAAVGAGAVGGPGAVVAEITGLRRAVTARVAALIGRHGETAEKAIRRLGSPTARLHTRFVGGEDDEKGGTDRQAAARRIDEILRLRPAARDIAVAVAAPLAADTGHQFALALADKIAAAVDHLAQYLPRDPGTARHLLSSDWLPSDAQAEELAVRLEAVLTPFVALDRLLSGDVDPAAADTLWATSPGIMEHARMELLIRLPEMEDLDMGAVAGLSSAFRTPFDGLLLPHNVAHMQAMYARDTQPSPSPNASGSAPKPQRGPGRPAATDDMTHAQSLAS